MQLPSGVEAAAVASGLAAALCTSMLVSSAGRRTGAARQAHQLLAAGVALAALTTMIGLTRLAVMAPHWSHHRAERTDLATVVSIGMALSGLLLCAGLLRLPGVAPDAATALRHILDATMIAAAVWFVGWVLLSKPTEILGTATPYACPAIVLATLTAVAAVGLTSMVAMRCPPPRRGLILVGCGITAAAGGGLGLATGICQVGSGAALSGAGVLTAGLVVVAVAGRATDRPGEPDLDIIRRGSAYAFLPMLGMAVSAVYHLLLDGRFTAPGIIAAIVEGFTLMARQYLALLDVRGYATRLAEREAHFRELAHTDPLTGLANRRGLLRALYRQDAGGSPCVLLGMDLDGFKNINDMRGHDVGDAVLIEVGQRLRQNLRPGDVAARLGGDEFAVLMRTGPAEAQRAAERLLGVLGLPYVTPEGSVFLSVSIGMADWASAPDVATLLRNADLALRAAKQRGKNRVEHYDITYDQLLRRRTTLEHEMRGAVERGELHLAFQPVVSLPSVRPVGAEALLRWHHPRLGNVQPDEFIPLAEDCGMIAKLGSWVLHQACHQLSQWLSDGHDVWVSVNVSPRELHAPEYVVQVTEALSAHRVPPQRLVLEVTEHAVATDLDELARRLCALRSTGVRIALDDFGAGYSSLGQLRRLPIDILKIDHSLVAEQELPRDAVRSARAFVPMVDVVMRLGHQLGLEVIAEGVTSQREFAAVVEAGCRFGQGRLFGCGVPAEHLEAMLDAATSPGARATGGPPTKINGVGGRPAPRQAPPDARAAVPPHAFLPVPLPGPATVTRRGDVTDTGDGREQDERNQGPAASAQDVRSVDSSREIRQA